MKRAAAAVLIAMLLVPGVALAGSSTDAALGLGAFAVFNQILSGTGIFGLGRSVVAAPPVYAPQPVYARQPVYAPQPVYVVPPPIVVAPRPVFVHRYPGPVYYQSRARYVPAPPAWGHGWHGRAYGYDRH
jgi:hypothetical protein